MPSTIPILRARRERRLARQRAGKAARETPSQRGDDPFTPYRRTHRRSCIFIRQPDARSALRRNAAAALSTRPTGCSSSPRVSMTARAGTSSSPLLPTTHRVVTSLSADTNPQHLPGHWPRRSLPGRPRPLGTSRLHPHHLPVTNRIQRSHSGSSLTCSSSTNRLRFNARCVNASSRRRSPRSTGAPRSWSGISTRPASAGMHSVQMRPHSFILENPATRAVHR
jgi:hypothetical protein